MWLSRCRRFGFPARHLAEHAHDVAAAREADRAHLAIQALPVHADQDARLVCRLLAADDLLCEDLSRVPSIPGCDHRCELLSAAIADELPRGFVQPADDARGVDDVAGDADGLERILDVGVELVKSRHAHSRTSGCRRSSTWRTSTSSRPSDSICSSTPCSAAWSATSPLRIVSTG